MPKGMLSVIGFLFFVLGFLSIILGMIGLRIKLLGFLDSVSPLLSFLIKLSLIILGIIFMYTDYLRQSNE